MKLISPAVPAEIPQFNIANVTFINAGAGIANFSSDNKTFYGIDSTNKYILKISTNVDTSTTPTWTNVHSFPNTHTIGFVKELKNGELMITTDVAGNPSHVWVTSGMAGNPANLATCTYTDVFQQPYSNPFSKPYCGHQCNDGSNGVVIISDSGAQTSGGAGNDTVDNTRAVRVYASYNFLQDTPQQIFNIRDFCASLGVPYTTNSHIHGVAYDQDWDRAYICFGDDTGHPGTTDALPTGYMQVVYVDDFYTKLKAGSTLNWAAFPLPSAGKYWPNSKFQILTIHITKSAVIMTPDVSTPLNLLIFPKVGYRKFGTAHCGPICSGGAVGGTPYRSNLGARGPTFFTQTSFTTQTASNPWFIMVMQDDGFTFNTMYYIHPVQTPNMPMLGYYSIYGPTTTGKLVGLTGMYLNNDNTKTTMVCDLVRPPTPGVPTAGLATLVAGTVTVSAPQVATDSKIVVTADAVGGTPGTLSVSKTAGTGFTITSSSNTDTSTVAWILM